MLRNLLIYIIVIVGGGFLTSCNDSLGYKESELVPDAPGTVTLRFRNSGFTRAGATKVESNETVIKSLIIALFPEGNNGMGGPDIDVPEMGGETDMQNLTRAAPGQGSINPDEGNEDEETKAAFVFKYSNMNEYEEATVTLPLTKLMIDVLFYRNNQTCKMIALANVPEEYSKSLSANPTKSEMMNLAVTTQFDIYNENDQLQDQDSFVMAGEGTVEYVSSAPPIISPEMPLDDNEIEGSASNRTPAKLYRAAAKIRLNVDVETEVIAKDGSKWTPVLDDTDNIRISAYLNNGVQTSTVYPDSVRTPEADDYYTCRPRRLVKTENADYPYGMDIPFYTYSNNWSDRFEAQTTMTLMVPWQKEGEESSFRYFYYLVPVTPAEMTEIVRNHSYTVNLKVGMLGGEEETPLTVEPSYQIIKWNEEQIEVNLDETRYLVVTPNVMSVYNIEDFQVPFYTSHPVEITDITLSFERFAFVARPDADDVGKVITIPVNETQINLTNDINKNNPVHKYILKTDLTETPSGQNLVSISHPLIAWDGYETVKDDDGSESETLVRFYGGIGTNDRTSAAPEEVRRILGLIQYYRPSEYPAYSPYVITFHIQHKDRPAFADDVKIYHYPAMYIQAEENPTERLTDAQEPPFGNVYINGENYISDVASESSNKLGALLGLIIKGGNSETTNKNPYMYIATTTQLNEGLGYVIGDPRATYINNDLSSEDNLTDTGSIAESTEDDWSKKASALYPKDGNERKLLYYYPSKENGLTIDMIAPKFRVASSWATGSLYVSSEESMNKVFEVRKWARRRAATYQEQGYPAGRWRLPTFAEFKYIVQLSADHKIPVLFRAGQGYWTAHGLGYYEYKGPNSTNPEIYLVTYDEKNFGNLNNRLTNVRPVYDEWYWEQYKNYPGSLKNGDDQYIYTLGDVPRGTSITD